MFGTNTYLSDVMSVITEVLTIFSQEPVIYFVMLALIAGSVGVVRRIIPTKKG